MCINYFVVSHGYAVSVNVHCSKVISFLASNQRLLWW